jgi:hypothetical protein
MGKAPSLAKIKRTLHNFGKLDHMIAAKNSKLSFRDLKNSVTAALLLPLS